jgi:hypothetical protein
MSLRWWLEAAGALSRRPDLWTTAVGQLFRLARPGWWRRLPFLPVPDAAYLRFRLVTAYGGTGDVAPGVDDLIAYLHWCRAWPRVVGGAG